MGVLVSVWLPDEENPMNIQNRLKLPQGSIFMAMEITDELIANAMYPRMIFMDSASLLADKIYRGLKKI